jgi:2-polyprenyl-3-methyl-5-hydroxy-6-metoxy-1,4-benzoquinol methylase
MSSASTIVTPSCSHCGGACKLHFVTQDYNRRIGDEHFRHYQCTQCALLFIHPVPEDLGRYYPNDYYYVPESIDFLDVNHGHEKYKIDIIRRFKTSGRLLEIGPSLGTFSYAAKLAGFEVNAIEMSTECSQYLNNVAHIPTVNTADTDAALLSLKPFDVITLWHVIEHLVDPWKTLDHIARRLKPDGICILAAPNPDAFQFKVIGKRWPHVDAPRHLYLIPQEVLVERAQMYGLTLEFATTDDEGARGWNTFGWEYWLGNFVRNPKRKAFMHRMGKKLARLVRRWDQKEGRGSAYTLVFRKAGS